jgi:hypothetical protein
MPEVKSPPTRELGSRRELDLLGVLRRLEAIRPARFATFTILLYVVLAIFAYLPGWPGDPHRLVGCACGDPAQQAWYLGWVPWALVHGHNPFFTTWMEYPRGVNLAANTEMPLLGLLSAPITFTAGPVSSFSLLLWLAYPISATSAFFVLRRWTGANIPAAVGGLLYGFSAYVVAQGLGHLNLSFVPLPPLIFLGLFEVLVRQHSRPHRWGILLGVLVAAQFLISPEVLTTTIVVAVCGVVILGLARYRTLDHDRLVFAWQSFWPALIIVAALLSYPAYFQLAGPLGIHGPIQGLMNPYRADLLGPVVPTSAQRFAPAAATQLGDKFTFTDVSETGSYLGIPLVLLALWCAVRYRRDRWVVLAGVLGIVVYVLSLGPTLTVAAHQTSVPLPFDAVGRLPLLNDILPTRFSLYQSFFVALVVGLGLSHALARDELGTAKRRGRAEAAGARGPAHHLRPARTARRRALSQVALAALCVAAIVALIPSWPRTTADIGPAVPSFFTSAANKQIPEGSVVLSFPFTAGTSDEAMLWQEIDLWRWKLMGGYAATPNGTGGVTALPPPLAPIAVQEFLAYWTTGAGGYLVETPPAANSHLVAQLRTYVRRYRIGTVVLDSSWPQAAIVLAVLRRALGDPVSQGGVDLWLNAETRARGPSR